MSNLFGDPNLQVMAINDFTPGIHRWTSGGNTIYPASAPVGSAADAHRCYAIPGVGLAPFFTYQPCQTFGSLGAGAAQQMVMGNMDVLSTPTGNGDSLVTTFTNIYLGGNGLFSVTRGDMTPGSVVTPTQVYTSSQTPYVGGFNVLNTIDVGGFQNPTHGNYLRNVITTDSMNFRWVIVPNWNDTSGLSDSGFGAFAAPAVATPRMFYHNGVVGVWQSPSNTTTDGFVTGAGDQMNVAAPDTIGSFAFLTLAFPELGGSVATWGSISTGEYVAIYGDGGAALINGGLVFSGITSIIKLPGVVGPGRAMGKGALSPIGLVYATDDDGVYVWNGSNSSQKLSQAVPDSGFYRFVIWNGSNLIGANQAAWNQFVMFPNNWVFDSETNGFWLVEDPAVVDFQVHTAGSESARYFYSSQGYATAAVGNTTSITTYMWDKMTNATSYYWLSNPISTAPGALVSIQTIELTATNPTSSPSTVTITPQAPVGQVSFAQQNQAQPLVFTIPPFTTSWRGAQRSGYTDYNTELRVDATNLTTNPAPIIHEITVGYTQTRTSSIQ